jgi:hypothetical protein
MTDERAALRALAKQVESKALRNLSNHKASGVSTDSGRTLGKAARSNPGTPVKGSRASR